MKNEATVELDQVSLLHGTVPILREISLRLTDGVTLLYGANGAGKSSLLKLIAGLQVNVKITGQGRVLHAPLTPRAASERAKIGYMPQQGGLYEELSSLENLQFRAAMLGLEHPQASCLELVDTYGLSTIMKQRVEHLSGGWRQRLAFALSMLAQPQLLLLDEPTAGVDLDAKARIWEQIDRAKRSGTRIMISSHDPQEAYRADHLIHLHRGRIEYSGAPTALVSHFGLRVAHLARPADLATLQRLSHSINSTLSPLFIDVVSVVNNELMSETLRMVIAHAGDHCEQLQAIWTDETAHLLRWSEPNLEDGLRAALLMSDHQSLRKMATR